MGPHSFKCGKTIHRGSHLRLRKRASMGPHSFKCGKRDITRNQSLASGSLQWGRTLSSAERTRWWMARYGHSRSFNGAALFQVRKDGDVLLIGFGFSALQWGRTLSSAERATWLFKPYNPKPLQWGRTLSSAESFSAGSRRYGAILGFNGAALFQVRKGRSAHFFIGKKNQLQWGRTLSSAESRAQ